MLDAAISRNCFSIANLSITITSATVLEGTAWDQTGGTVMCASGAPDNVNTRSIEHSFSLLVTCVPSKG